jgi:hypothetical protein
MYEVALGFVTTFGECALGLAFLIVLASCRSSYRR